MSLLKPVLLLERNGSKYTVIGRVARRIWSVAMRDLYSANERSSRSITFKPQDDHCMPVKSNSTIFGQHYRLFLHFMTTATHYTQMPMMKR